MANQTAQRIHTYCGLCIARPVLPRAEPRPDCELRPDLRRPRQPAALRADHLRRLHPTPAHLELRPPPRPPCRFGTHAPQFNEDCGLPLAPVKGTGPARAGRVSARITGKIWQRPTARQLSFQVIAGFGRNSADHTPPPPNSRRLPTRVIPAPPYRSILDQICYQE
jgi:hypothetical protein